MKKIFLATLASLLMLGCSKSPDSGLPGLPTGKQKTLTFSLKGISSALVNYPASKAVTTDESENSITQLDIYMFQDIGSGDYRLSGVYEKVVTQGTGADKTATFSVEGIGATRFFFLANAPKESHKSLSELKRGETTADAFSQITSDVISASPAIPLIMSGVSDIVLKEDMAGDNSNKLNVTLNRSVARIDITNSAAGFVLTKTEIRGTRNATYLFAQKPGVVTPETFAKIDYSFDNATSNPTTPNGKAGTFYPYEGEESDNVTVVLYGTFTDNGAEAVYEVPFEKTVAGAVDKVAIRRNNVYTVKLVSVDANKVDVAFKVQDWDDATEEVNQETGSGDLKITGLTMPVENNQVIVGKGAQAEFKLQVEASTAWTASTDTDWITISDATNGKKTFIVSLALNTTSANRKGMIRFKNNINGAVLQDFYIIQQGRDFSIKSEGLVADNIALEKSEGKTINLALTYAAADYADITKWEAIVEDELVSKAAGDGKWITLTKAAKSVTAVVSANSGAPRTTYIVFNDLNNYNSANPISGTNYKTEISRIKVTQVGDAFTFESANATYPMVDNVITIGKDETSLPFTVTSALAWKSVVGAGSGWFKADANNAESATGTTYIADNNFGDARTALLQLQNTDANVSVFTKIYVKQAALIFDLTMTDPEGGADIILKDSKYRVAVNENAESRTFKVSSDYKNSWSVRVVDATANAWVNLEAVSTTNTPDGIKAVSESVKVNFDANTGEARSAQLEFFVNDGTTDHVIRTVRVTQSALRALKLTANGALVNQTTKIIELEAALTSLVFASESSIEFKVSEKTNTDGVLGALTGKTFVVNANTTSTEKTAIVDVEYPTGVKTEYTIKQKGVAYTATDWTSDAVGTLTGTGKAQTLTLTNSVVSAGATTEITFDSSITGFTIGGINSSIAAISDKKLTLTVGENLGGVVKDLVVTLTSTTGDVLTIKIAQERAAFTVFATPTAGNAETVNAIVAAGTAAQTLSVTGAASEEGDVVLTFAGTDFSTGYTITGGTGDNNGVLTVPLSENVSGASAHYSTVITNNATGDTLTITIEQNA